MNKNYLPGWGKTAWQNNKPFLAFIAGLLLVLSVLKIAFYHYNYSFVLGSSYAGSWYRCWRLIGWSLQTDLLVLLLLNFPFWILLTTFQWISPRLNRYMVVPLWVLLNAIVLLLNLADIFYFRFHFQRANADWLDVLQHPLAQLMAQPWRVILGIMLGILLCLIYSGWLTRKLWRGFVAGKRALVSGIVLCLLLLTAALFPRPARQLLHPAHPLVALTSSELLVVQNSAHCFVYSLLRKGEELKPASYFTDAPTASLLPVKKLLPAGGLSSNKRNVMLFIMESIPYDFFDSSSSYKVTMPFLDSLLKKSTLFTNAFCFAHQSNKGITALLAAVPTLTDIPLYHSGYVNLPITHIGEALRSRQYRSFFCIGDDYDNFGFAKCSNWLGFDHYYCRQDIPGYTGLPSHPMGVQDAYVLDFVHQQINATASPFFGVFYNVSTHYPYTLPAGFQSEFPATYSAPMKSMRYYDYSLGKFFREARKEPWFENTVFIFCSDHWLVPDEQHVQFTAISGYHIPIILYDPQQPEGKKDDRLCSQFDIMGTVLSYAGYRDSIISYGGSLTAAPSSCIFSRANASLYHVADSNYILGFNSTTGKPEFLYAYRQDRRLEHNLLQEPAAAPEAARLDSLVKIFLQQATAQYNGSFPK
ncbi:MAG: sulfatase-like hydrolase/transferase [Ferruginibacter sp.]